MTGNLGSDGSTQSQQPAVQYRGRAWNYLYTRDNGPSDPPVTHLLVPGDPEELGRVQYYESRQRDDQRQQHQVAGDFLCGSVLRRAGSGGSGMTQDLTVRAGAGGPDASVFGTYVDRHPRRIGELAAASPSAFLVVDLEATCDQMPYPDITRNHRDRRGPG